MKRLLIAGLALALSGCLGAGEGTPGLQVGPREGETPCAYGRRVMDEAQRRLDQARAAAAVTCAIVERPQ